MPLWSAFIGPSYHTRRSVVDAERCINLFPETTQSAGNAKKSALLGTPGIRPFAEVPETDGRGWYRLDSRPFTVVGGKLYEVDVPLQSMTPRGAIADDGKPVSMCSNGPGGSQLAIVGGGQLKIFNLVTNVLSAAIVLPFTNPVAVAFVDGYFLINQQGTPIVWYSALEDGTSWDALDFFARSSSADAIVTIAAVRDHLWTLGDETTEIYYDGGDADNPFVPYPGSLLHAGLVSAAALARDGDTLSWVATDSQGAGRVVRAGADAAGLTVISNPPISVALASEGDLSTTESLVYEQEGHTFIVWTVGAQSWAYDVSEQQWHERASWDTGLGVYVRWRVRGCCAVGGQILVGDANTGKIGTLDPETYDEYGTTIRRLRSSPYLSDDNQPFFLDQLELGAAVGVGLPTGQGRDPELMLRVSGDGGQTWGPTDTAKIGAGGAYDTAAIWRRLGQHRADRLVIEITQTDPVPAIWSPGVWLRATPSTGQR